MIRNYSTNLDKWLFSSSRRPLVLRGARQVGKTWLVRDLAKRHSKQLIELNLERFPLMARHFLSNDPKRALRELSIDLNVDIDIGKALLFLDEIQGAPELLAALRWFKEDLPELPVIAAGSLLEFALQSPSFSMPVGRINYFFVEPMTFSEFLVATGEKRLAEYIYELGVGDDINLALHEKLNDNFRAYQIVGGMPEVVKEWSDTGSFKIVSKIQQDILATFRDDFHKYRGKYEVSTLHRVMAGAAEQLGNKFVYSRTASDMAARDVRSAFHLLCDARICHKVKHTTGRGLPLGASTNEKFFKAIFMDTGLVCAELGLSSDPLFSDTRQPLFNQGGVSEQVVGQLLRASQCPDSDPSLFYWQKIKKGQAEIDYVIQHGPKIVPIEIKSGAAGSMKSLHGFMEERNFDIAVRFDTNPWSLQEINVSTLTQKKVSYRLFSLPHYLAEFLGSFLEQV